MSLVKKQIPRHFACASFLGMTGRCRPSPAAHRPKNRAPVPHLLYSSDLAREARVRQGSEQGSGELSQHEP